MKSLKILFVVACLGSGMLSMGCTTHHSETDRDTITGGRKHEETTTTRNPITGETSTEHSETKTH